MEPAHGGEEVEAEEQFHSDYYKGFIQLGKQAPDRLYSPREHTAFPKPPNDTFEGTTSFTKTGPDLMLFKPGRLVGRCSVLPPLLGP